MRITRLLLLGGVLLAPIGSSLSDMAWGQEQNGGQSQDRGPGGPGGGGRGQGRGGFGGRMMGGISSIIGMPEVQTELKLDDAQKQSLVAIREEMGGGRGGPGGPGGGPGGRGGPGGPGGGFGGGPGAGGPPSEEQMKEMADRMKKSRAEVETKISDVLDPDQNTRLLGLLIQREGGRALSSRVLTSALELSPEQLTKLDEAEDASRKESSAAMRDAMGGGGDWTKMRAQMEEMNKKAGDSMIAVLTSEQKTKFESMKGEAFTFPEGGRGGFGGPGGPGGPGGGRGNRPGGGRGERPNIQ